MAGQDGDDLLQEKTHEVNERRIRKQNTSGRDWPLDRAEFFSSGKRQNAWRQMQEADRVAVTRQINCYLFFFLYS